MVLYTPIYTISIRHLGDSQVSYLPTWMKTNGFIKQIKIYTGLVLLEIHIVYALDSRALVLYFVGSRINHAVAPPHMPFLGDQSPAPVFVSCFFIFLHLSISKQISIIDLKLSQIWPVHPPGEQ